MKKNLIITAIIAVVVIGALLCMHYFPLWVSVTNVLVFAAGLVCGWLARVLYAKYDEDHENY